MNCPIKQACDDVASAVFPHNNWRNERARLAETLVALVEAVSAQGTSASGQDPKGLEAKPAGPVHESGCAQDAPEGTHHA